MLDKARSAVGSVHAPTLFEYAPVAQWLERLGLNSVRYGFEFRQALLGLF